MSYIKALGEYNKQLWTFDAETMGKRDAIIIRSAHAVMFAQAIALLGLVIAASVTQNTRISLALKIVAGSTVATGLGCFGYHNFLLFRRPNRVEECIKYGELLDNHIGSRGKSIHFVISTQFILSLVTLTGLLIAASVTKSAKVNLAFKAVAGIAGGTFILLNLSHLSFFAHKLHKKK